jgi:hypothetical protein
MFMSTRQGGVVSQLRSTLPAMSLRHALLGAVLVALVYPALAVEYQYWGCVEDAVARRAVPNLLLRATSMTLEVCEDLAKQQGYSVFGVQYSTECFGSKYH